MYSFISLLMYSFISLPTVKLSPHLFKSALVVEWCKGLTPWWMHTISYRCKKTLKPKIKKR